ncbi:hypothetical protein, partial [Dysosmobacter welbionis]|uniref:hypothetical protein n=1 Tax=Dysosmobacter welbionis TaxID=2093857 RepID=UPI003A933372
QRRKPRGAAGLRAPPFLLHAECLLETHPPFGLAGEGALEAEALRRESEKEEEAYGSAGTAGNA